jgi:putative tricarboxylic transport membrane protein
MGSIFSEVLVQLFTLTNLVYAVGGVVLGMVIGSIPGLTVTLGIILLLPMTYGMDTITSIIALLAIYVGGCYGGSISAILINTPGTNSALATTLDGYPLAKKGKANKALSTSLFSSSLGGLLGALILLFAAPPIAAVAMKFRSPEYFSLAIFGLTVIAGVSGDNVIKGIISAFFGIFIACIGLEQLSGTLRYTFGSIALFGGISLLPALIGLIALAQVIIKTVEVKTAHARPDADLQSFAIEQQGDDPAINRREIRSILKTILVSTGIGTIIGAMPGAGGGVAQFVSYNEARRSSRHPEEFGKGSLEGIAAAESSNNTVVGSAMIPLLTLGIPGDGVTAILLGALILHGLEPGPKLFTEQAVETYSIIVGLVICNILLYFLGKIFTKQVSKVIRIPYKNLGIAISLFCFAGAFANSGNVWEMVLIVPLAAAGYFLGLLGFSVIPMMLGLILGPIVENNFTRSMIVYDNDVLIFFKEPISCAILVIAVVFTILITRMNKQIEALAAEQADELQKEG